MFGFSKFPWSFASKPSSEATTDEACEDDGGSSCAPELPDATPPEFSSLAAKPRPVTRVAPMVRMKIGTVEAVISQEARRIIDTASRAMISTNVANYARTAVLQAMLRTADLTPRGGCRGGKCKRC